MEAGNVNEFLEKIAYQEEAVIFNEHKYFFNPCEQHGVGKLEIQQWNLNDEWEADFFNIESKTTEECVKKMVSLPIWNGRTFWEVEPEMIWTEW